MSGLTKSLFRPDRKNTFTEGKVAYIGDWDERDIKAFINDEGWPGAKSKGLIRDFDRSFLTSYTANGWKK